VILQGDSRKLCEVVSGADIVVSSPPYAEIAMSGGTKGPDKYGTGLTQGKLCFGDYGQTPGQLGAMKPGKLADCIVSSPPFQEQVAAQDIEFYKKKCVQTGRNPESAHAQAIDTYGQAPGQLGAMKPGKIDAVIGSPPFQGEHGGACDKTSMKNMDRPGRAILEGHGDNPENLANLKPGDVDAIVSSPPYTKHALGHGAGKRAATEYDKRLKRQREMTEQMQSQGNLAKLEVGNVDAIVSSPPYEGSLHLNESPEVQAERMRNKGQHEQAEAYLRSNSKQGNQGYGAEDGNLGNDKGPTFWQAARDIVSQCYEILKPGGMAIWVVKSFVRKGAVVDFPGDWLKLCESVGFQTVCEHHAMLVKETTEDGLFGEITEKKEKKSFFRRLAEKKGSPEINYEVVLCTQKQT
jgi:hypothetical protein